MVSENNSTVSSELLFSEKNTFKNYHLTAILSLPVIGLGVYSDFYLQKDPEHFTQAVTTLYYLIQNLEVSNRLNSTILSIGSDVATPVAAFLCFYTLTNFLNDQMINHLIPESKRNLIDREAPQKIHFYTSILVGCGTSLLFVLLEISKTAEISELDWADILAFSVPIIATIFYIVRVYSNRTIRS